MRRFAIAACAAALLSPVPALAAQATPAVPTRSVAVTSAPVVTPSAARPLVADRATLRRQARRQAQAYALLAPSLTRAQKAKNAERLAVSMKQARIPVGERAAAIAKTQLGTPYLYGGSSPATGFDCSGLTQWAFAKAGASIPRTAAAQQKAVARVAEPRVGDLVFFGAPAYHVGIYTGEDAETAEDTMVDSPHTGAKIEDSGFWAPTGFGRVG